ncbi:MULTISPECIES: anthranilate synthase component I family protein [unclassified Rathayibacter]|uniref:anthranilate synthase component I family protein n=1 Tax=unclassified Rathayibacter TaxID=2609250 RepID=UPI0010E222E1|nr:MULTISPECIES: anthranilate synthase component I family protein [unclassified Rathayibacter]TCL78296.1 anthranilate synthase component 1 [Rathayibacter sp. PhB192]TCM23899.1 anthranilate synthase component 1 [Rathayibacter sp. PhB179]
MAALLEDPALRRELPWVDPERAYLALFAGADASFWLDSGRDAVEGLSFLGSSDDVLTVEAGSDVSAALAAVGEERSGDRALGRYGWISYEAGAPFVSLPVAPTGADAPPALALIRGDPVLEFDQARRSLHLVSSSRQEPEARRLERALAALAAAPDASDEPRSAEPAGHVEWRHDSERYRALIAHCQTAIRAGDAYQLCLTNEVVVEGAFDPVAAYRRLRRSSPSHHGGLIRIGGLALVSASPERFLDVTADGRVATHPIKGTRTRSADPVVDAELRAELLASVKERAENVMIVDLVRNDLARIAAPASVQVDRLLEIETYPHVHQLVSEVSAQLAPGVGPAELLAATFPAGSMTGAPKRRAIELLREWEAGPRGLYAGAFGRLGGDGSLDLAMTIRTLVLDGVRARIGTGGGITALSVPDEEVEETRLKARALLAALGVDLHVTAESSPGR